MDYIMKERLKKNLRKVRNPKIKRKNLKIYAFAGLIGALFFFTLVLSLPPISASLQKDYTSIGKYGTIILNDCSFLGCWLSKTKIAEYTLIDNTKYCLDNCRMYGTATLYSEEKLFNDAKFFDIKINSREKALSYSQYFIKTTESYTEDINDYGQICNDVKYIDNKTLEEKTGKNCYAGITGFHKETKTRDVWKEYNYDILSIGTYEWELRGKLNPGEKVDAIPYAQNIAFSEWITWTSANCSGTGGAITYDGEYCVHTFLTNGTFNTTLAIANASVLVVAGGGGGGDNAILDGVGGGGGAGGLLYNSSGISFSGNYTLVVGIGGEESDTAAGLNGVNGSNSSIKLGAAVLYDAIGGGGGAGEQWNGSNGGSGGGAMSVNGFGGKGLPGQGYDGGYPDGAPPPFSGGGGGGSSHIGYNASGGTNGNGGNGTIININGTAICYAGGGGGGSDGAVLIGSCGGGNGTWQDTNSATNGTNGLGGGGGGGAHYAGYSASRSVGRGGSGIIIIRYKSITSRIITSNVILNSPVNYFNTTLSSIILNCSVNITGAGALNLTLRINDIDNYTIVNSTGYQNLSLQRTLTLPTGKYNWSCKSSADDSTEVISSTRFFNMSNFVENSITYSTPVGEGSSTNFTYNTTLGQTLNSAYFIYNNTQYSTSISVIGNNYIFKNNNFIVPTVTADRNMTFYWQINLANGQVNSTKTNQTVLNIAIDNCAVGTLKILNMSLRDEASQLFVIPDNNSVIDINLQIYSLDYKTLLGEYNNNFTGTNNASVCLTAGALNNSNYYMDAEIKYNLNSTYAIEYYHIQKYLLTNNTALQEINLYDLLLTSNTNFLVIFKDSYFVPVSKALIIIQRKYISEGLFKTVEIPLTDKDGQAVAHLDTNGIIYSISVVKNGVTLGTFNSVVPICQDTLTGQCTINLNADSSTGTISDYNTFQNLNYLFNFTAKTRTIIVDFQTVDGTSANVLLNATKNDRFGNDTICSPSLTASSGKLTCNIPAGYGNVSIIASLYKDNQLITTNTYSINPSQSDTFGTDGFIMVFILLITLPMMFIPSKTTMVFSVFIGAVTASGLMFFNGGSMISATSSVIWLLIAGMIIIYKINEGGES